MDRNIVHFGAKSVEGFCPDFSEQTYVTSAWSPMYMPTKCQPWIYTEHKQKAFNALHTLVSDNRQSAVLLARDAIA